MFGVLWILQLNAFLAAFIVSSATLREYDHHLTYVCKVSIDQTQTWCAAWQMNAWTLMSSLCSREEKKHEVHWPPPSPVCPGCFCPGWPRIQEAASWRGGRRWTPPSCWGAPSSSPDGTGYSCSPGGEDQMKPTLERLLSSWTFKWWKLRADQWKDARPVNGLNIHSLMRYPSRDHLPISSTLCPAEGLNVSPQEPPRVTPEL